MQSIFVASQTELIQRFSCATVAPWSFCQAVQVIVERLIVGYVREENPVRINLMLQVKFYLTVGYMQGIIWTGTHVKRQCHKDHRTYHKLEELVTDFTHFTDVIISI